MHNIPIRFRIGTAVLLPLLVVVCLASYQVVDKHRELRQMNELCALIDLAPAISGLIHELQKERGLSSGFIASKGSKFAEALPRQRRDGDAALIEAKSSITATTARLSQTGLSPLIVDAESALGRLTAIREGISRLDIPLKDVADYYTNTISYLFNIIERLGVISDDAQVSRAVVAYMALLRAKEATGLQRAMGAAGFGAGAFEQPIYVRFLTVIARQQTYFDQFDQFASDEAKRFRIATLTGPAVDDVARMQQLAIDSPRTGTTGGVQADDWFNKITAKIDLLRKIEEHQTADLRELTQSLRGSTSVQYTSYLIAAIVVTLVTIGFAVAMAHSVTAPLKAIVGIIRRITEGDAEVQVNGVERADEFGAIARALKVFRDHKVENERLEEARQAAEARNLAERRAAVMDMANRIETETQDSVQQLQDEATQMAGVSEDMSRLTEVTGQNAQGVAAASEQMMRIAETVAAAAEELAASSDDIRRQASSVGDMSRSAAREAERATETMTSLLQAANNVGGVLDLIKEIAEKTHLLALNATIEAARAGEAGRGFAVVASEVKLLADQTAKATDQINEQIQGMRSVTADSSTAINEVSRVIQSVAQIAGDVISAVEQQRMATQEISGNMQQNAQSSREVTERIADVSEAARGSSELAHRVLDASQALHTSVGNLRGTISRIVRSTTDANRREFERRGVDISVTIDVRGRSYDGTLKNLSKGGANVIVSGDFASGEEVKVHLVGDAGQISATVVGYRADAQSLHLKFQEADQQRIDALLGGSNYACTGLQRAA